MDLTILSPSQGLEVWWSTEQGDCAVLGQLQAAEEGIVSAWLYGDSLNDELPLPGQSVSVRVPSGRGLIAARGIVLPDGPSGLTRIALAGAPRRLQSRLYARVDMNLLPARGYLLGSAGEPAWPFDARLLDLSGGGLRFETYETLAGDDRFRLEFVLEDGSLVAPTVEIVSRLAERTIWQPAGLSGCYVRYEVRGTFAAISELERYRIVRYVARRRSTSADLEPGPDTLAS